MQRLCMLWEHKGDGPQIGVWPTVPKLHQLETESRLGGASSDLAEHFLHF